MTKASSHKAVRSITLGLTGAAIALLALPALAVHGWMAATFPSYLHGSFGQDLVFALAWCALLVFVSRWRLLGFLSIPVGVLAYLVWLFLVLGEAVSYYLQADTFNARFFAHLNPGNLRTGLHAFPAMIGGGVAVFLAMALVCSVVLAAAWRQGRKAGASVRSGPAIVALVILVLTVLGVDSSPRRLISYLARVQQSSHFADTPQGRAVARLLDLHPVPKQRLIAAPGKNLVMIYLESLERIYWDPKVFPGLTPNFDRLRKQGLDFSGFETFSGATYTIAGMFASQCGVPLFTSPFSGLDMFASNDTDIATFHPKLVCLGDVLHDAGYTQVYMGGAPITFSNKGLFYRLHGFDQALGLRGLEKQAGNKLPESGWGLYDSALFPLMLQRYRELEAAGKPFNLAMITLDTHPPDGRPSPGCPKYAASSNSMLQAVHCTDHLVGKFIDALSKEPDWKNTVVLIMSDHLMMRNVAEPLFPEGYHRQPSLLILNAGQGDRRARMYHMDIAPTLLDLMGVRTNATFIAGGDRSSPDAKGSQLVDTPVTDAVLRKALWSTVNEFALCKHHTLIGWTRDGGFDVGGRELRMSLLGRQAVGIYGDQSLAFFIDNANVKLATIESGEQSKVLAARGDADVLTISPLPDRGQLPDSFSVDWVGRHGARAHIADIPRLEGLTIQSPRCDDLIARADRAPEGARLDLSHEFETSTASVPRLSSGPGVDFRQPDSVGYEAGYGWLPPAGWGSFTIGPDAILQFRLPDGMCRAGTMLQMQVDPYLPPSRPRLDTEVWVNGKLETTWHFKADGKFSRKMGDSDRHTVVEVEAPLDAGSSRQARVDLRFVRPDTAPPPYPKPEDPRALQLRVLGLRLVPVAGQ